MRIFTRKLTKLKLHDVSKLSKHQAASIISLIFLLRSQLEYFTFNCYLQITFQHLDCSYMYMYYMQYNLPFFICLSTLLPFPSTAVQQNW